MNSKDPRDLSESTTSTSTYALPGLELQQRPFVFTYVSLFLSFITPHDLPVELLRDAVHSNVTLVELIRKVMKIESGFLFLIAIFIILSVAPLIAALTWCCKRKMPTKNQQDSMNSLMIRDDTFENRLQCRRRASIYTLVLIFFILIGSDVMLFVTNSQLSSTIEMAPNVIKATLSDVETYLKDTHVQIENSLGNGFDNAVKLAITDLEDIDILLGEPIQIEVSASTGIELAFDSLSGISAANIELISRILHLQESIAKSLKISLEAAARMEELQIQLSVLQRQCTFRDRPLCDTLRLRSFEENGIIDALKTLQEDQSIFKMRYLGELEVGDSVKNLSSEVEIAKSIFGNYPVQVKSETLSQRNETIDQLNLLTSTTTISSHMLTNTITSLLDQLKGTWSSIEPSYEKIRENSEYLLGFTTTVSLATLVIIFFILISFCCFCCMSKIFGIILLVISIVCITFASITLLIYAVLTLSIGGNGEIFLCRPLYFDENYETVGKIFDKPGLFYSKEPENGILAEILKPPKQNKTITHVSLSSAIRNCERNKSSYSVFKLDRFVNTKQSADISQYTKLNDAFNRIHVSEKTFVTLTDTIQSILESMLQTSDLNLGEYRTTISQPTPDKDLATFIDQMQRVALQIQDIATSSRMNTLGSRAKRLQASILQPLEQLRNEILYHLTALELQKDPWGKQVNQTLHHLENVQGYLKKTAGEICTNLTNAYIERIKNHFKPNKEKLLPSNLAGNTAPCRPLFNIFDANRTFLCRYVVDSLNGLWFLTFWILLIFSIGTPVGLNLVTLYRKIHIASELRHTNSHLYGTPSDTMLISEQSNWEASSLQRQSRMSSRQDTDRGSRRSVRWETTETNFDDDDGPPLQTEYI